MTTFATINIGSAANDGTGDPLRTAFGKINDVISAINAAGGIGAGGIGVGSAQVKAATTGSITLSGAQTIDGVSCVAGDLVLVKDQSAPANNGIYTVASGAWTRAPGFDAWSELTTILVLVEQGTTQADTAWQSTANAGGTLGVTSIPFVQVSSGTINSTRWAYLAAATAFGGGLLALADAAAGRAALTLSSSDTPTFAGLTLTDTPLVRDAANILALRNATAAQSWRIYNTYTDASNFERGALYWNSNELRLAAQYAGTGTFRAIAFETNGSARWRITTGGDLHAVTDNSIDIGASGANRPRDVYAGRNFVAGGYVQAGASSDHYWTSRSRMFSDADGNIRLTNNAQSDFGLLQLGGSTASFPALKRSGTELHLRLADDSSYATLEAGNIIGRAGFFGLGSANDVRLYREAANALSLRNGASAQSFQVFNTYTDSSNFERGVVEWTSNVLEVGTENLGTGVGRHLRLKAAGSNGVYFNTNGSDRFYVSGSGHLAASTDNAFDIGATTTNRPRNAFLAGYLSIGDGVTAPGATTGEAKLYVDTADGDLKVKFADGTTKVIVTDTAAKEQFEVESSAMKPRASNGCSTLTVVETTTHKVNFEVLNFDKDTIEYAQFWLRVPKRFGTSTFRARFCWRHGSGATAYNAVWGIQAQAFGDGESLDAAFGTAVEVTDSGGNADRNYDSPWTAACTIANLGAQERVCFQVYRKATDAADTLDVDAGLISVQFEFDVSQPSDD